jgi:hypothetical protein
MLNTLKKNFIPGQTCHIAACHCFIACSHPFSFSTHWPFSPLFSLILSVPAFIFMRPPRDTYYTPGWWADRTLARTPSPPPPRSPGSRQGAFANPHPPHHPTQLVKVPGLGDPLGGHELGQTYNWIEVGGWGGYPPTSYWFLNPNRRNKRWWEVYLGSARWEVSTAREMAWWGGGGGVLQEDTYQCVENLQG